MLDPTLRRAEGGDSVFAGDGRGGVAWPPGRRRAAPVCALSVLAGPYLLSLLGDRPGIAAQFRGACP